MEGCEARGMPKDSGRSGRWFGVFGLLWPSVTVFLSSGCIMILELVAARLSARYLGASLYTWTGIIAVVLAGISIGNAVGGRLSDHYNPTRLVVLCFIGSAGACGAILWLNPVVGEWSLLHGLNWPMRVFAHFVLVFFVPAVAIGTISPTVAKVALEKGLATGRTVGTIYASGAAGSIAGTFFAGFYLISHFGTRAIIAMVAWGLVLLAIPWMAASLRRKRGHEGHRAVQL